jgi:hypothetical protein
MALGTPSTAAAGALDAVREFGDASWREDGPTRAVEAVVEGGHVLVFPHLAFVLEEAERRFLDPRWTDGKAKNISVRWPAGELRGAAGAADDLLALRAMIVRYAETSEAFALRLFPHYRGHLRRGNTSFRPFDVAGRVRSWRQDDTRLHVDAFPSNPMQGTRLLRVFTNVNAEGQPRRWRVGEPFEAHARRYLGSIGRPWPGSAWLLHATGITKQRRTEYDHLMLQLHDRAKADAAFQATSPQARVDFAPGTTWVCYSDQVLHGALGGAHLLEQTFLLDVEHLQQPQTSPLRTLERLANRRLR